MRGSLQPAEPRPGAGHRRQPAPLLPAAPRQPTCSVPGAPVPVRGCSFALGHLPPVPSRSPGSALRLDAGKQPRLGRAGAIPTPRAGQRDRWRSGGTEPHTVLPARCSLPRGLRPVTGVRVSARTQPGWLSGSSAGALPAILVRMELGVPAPLSPELCWSWSLGCQSCSPWSFAGAAVWGPSPSVPLHSRCPEERLGLFCSGQGRGLRAGDRSVPSGAAGPRPAPVSVPGTGTPQPARSCSPSAPPLPVRLSVRPSVKRGGRPRPSAL